MKNRVFRFLVPPTPLKGNCRCGCHVEHPPLGGLGDVMQPGCRDAACRVISLAGDSTQNTQIMNLVLVAARPSFCTQIITDLEGFFICSICSICVRLYILAGSPARGGKCIGRGGAPAQPLFSARPSVQAPLGAAECFLAGDSTQIITDLEGFFICSIC